MDVENFDSTLKYVNLNGVTLNIEERIQLKLSLGQLQYDLKVDKVWFWGKINGNRMKYNTLKVLSRTIILPILLTTPS